MSTLSSSRLRFTAGFLLAASALLAQTANRGTTNTGRTQSMNVPTRSVGGGGGGTGGGSSAATSQRQYNNSTVVGDAMITSDPETRRLIIVTDDETNDNIRTIVASLDKPKPQVLINVVFVQVSHNKDLDLGSEASYTGKVSFINNTPTGAAQTKFGLGSAAADPLSFGGFYKIIGKDLTATLHALSAVNKTEILSRPSILTRSSQQATIMVGQSVPIITNSRVSDTTNTTVNTVQYQDVGIILRVTPFITAEGLVEMIVSPEISSLSATTVPISNTVSSPVIDKRSADTVVVTPSDQTVVIGGLISTQTADRDHKVPILGDIPLLGYAFKRKEKSDEKTELLVFLTPHVVQNPADLAKLSGEEQQKLELTPKTFEKAELKRYLDTK